MAAYQAKVIQRALIVSKQDLKPELAPTIIGRQGIEVYRVEKITDAKLVGQSLGVQVILVDREFPDPAAFIQKLRKEPATRDRSIAVLSRRAVGNTDRELLTAGANAILPLPPDAKWDDRFTKLLSVPVRQQARMPVHIEHATGFDTEAIVLNLSPGASPLVNSTPASSSAVGMRASAALIL